MDMCVTVVVNGACKENLAEKLSNTTSLLSLLDEWGMEISEGGTQLVDSPSS